MTGKAVIFEAMPTGDAQRIWDGGPEAQWVPGTDEIAEEEDPFRDNPYVN